MALQQHQSISLNATSACHAHLPTYSKREHCRAKPGIFGIKIYAMSKSRDPHRLKNQTKLNDRRWTKILILRSKFVTRIPCSQKIFATMPHIHDNLFHAISHLTFLIYNHFGHVSIVMNVVTFCCRKHISSRFAVPNTCPKHVICAQSAVMQKSVVQDAFVQNIFHGRMFFGIAVQFLQSTHLHNTKNMKPQYETFIVCL